MEVNPPLTEREFEILKKYKTPRKVDSEDKLLLEELSLIGFVRWGYNIKDKYETAVLTPEAITILEFWEPEYKKLRR
jgi:hypothetical protein